MDPEPQAFSRGQGQHKKKFSSIYLFTQIVAFLLQEQAADQG